MVQGGVVDGRSEDISEAGLLILSMAICATGQRVALRFAGAMVDGRLLAQTAVNIESCTVVQPAL